MRYGRRRGAKKTSLLLPLADKLKQLSFLGADFYVEEPFEEIRVFSPEDFFLIIFLNNIKRALSPAGKISLSAEGLRAMRPFWKASAGRPE